MTPPTSRLFAAGDLKVPLGRTVDDDEAKHAERIVWGWLKGPLKLEQRPDEIADEVWAWAVELATIYITNPSGLSGEQLGPSQRQFSSERRDEILELAGGGSSSSVAEPSGDFPPAPCYPDPARGGMYVGGLYWP